MPRSNTWTSARLDRSAEGIRVSGPSSPVDALAHVVRVFDDEAIPHVGEIDPLRDIKNVEFDLMVSDVVRSRKGWNGWKKI